jgi:chanoclavine-I dehydrogenase
MASLSGKVFALTAGASGLGLATACRLARLKARAISIGDINPSFFESARKKLHAINPDLQISTRKVDVASSLDVDAWIKDTVNTFDALDGAVNCAGVINMSAAQQPPLFLNETDETWNRVVDINLTGILYSMRAQVKAMLDLPKTPRSIVNVASAASLFHDPTIMSYCVTKHAVASLTTTVSKEIGPLGIRLNAVSPSMYPSLIFFENKIPCRKANNLSQVRPRRECHCRGTRTRRKLKPIWRGEASSCSTRSEWPRPSLGS